MFGSMWSVVVVHEHRRQDGSRRLSTSAKCQTATDGRTWAPWSRRAGVGGVYDRGVFGPFLSRSYHRAKRGAAKYLHFIAGFACTAIKQSVLFCGGFSLFDCFYRRRASGLVSVALNRSLRRFVYLVLSRVRPQGKGLAYLRRHHATADAPRTSWDDDKTTDFRSEINRICCDAGCRSTSMLCW